MITSEIVCHNSDVCTPHFSIYCLRCRLMIPCVPHSLSFPVFWNVCNMKCVFLQHSSPGASCPQQIALRAQYFSHSCCHLPALLLINLVSDAHHSSALCSLNSLACCMALTRQACGILKLSSCTVPSVGIYTQTPATSCCITTVSLAYKQGLVTCRFIARSLGHLCCNG